MIPMPALVTEHRGRKSRKVRVAGSRRPQLLAFALLLGGGACRHDSPETLAIVALMDSRAEQTESHRCVPTGGRDWRAGLRQPTRCSAKYAEGPARWDRDVWGAVQTAVRTWRLSPTDSARWPQLRDSVTALVAAIAGGAGPCASRDALAIGSQIEVWYFRGYGLAVHSLERLPGGSAGHELRLEVSREDTMCTLSRRRASSIYLRNDPAMSRPGGRIAGAGTVLEEAARAAGIPVLRTAALEADMRELRLSPGGSGMVWQPIPLLRLIERRSNFRWVSGELFFYWPRLRDSTGHDVRPHWATGQSECRMLQSTARWAACRIDVEPETTWWLVADSIQALGIWELPSGDSAEHRGSHLSDQDWVLGEMLVGDRYGNFTYRDVNRLRGENASRVWAAVGLIRNLLTRPSEKGPPHGADFPTGQESPAIAAERSGFGSAATRWNVTQGATDGVPQSPVMMPEGNR
jgi:hypothetical protein